MLAAVQCAARQLSCPADQQLSCPKMRHGVLTMTSLQLVSLADRQEEDVKRVFAARIAKKRSVAIIYYLTSCHLDKLWLCQRVRRRKFAGFLE